MSYHPPYTLNNALLSLVAEIAECLGEWRAMHPGQLIPSLCRNNRILSVHSSLAIEQNTLNIEQITQLMEGKSLLAPLKEVQEVRNAFKAYEAMSQWQSCCLEDCLQAHATLMLGLVDDPGQLRASGVGIYQGETLIHMAPPASQLPRLIHDLLHWLKHTQAHPLIASSAFHYEFEFIHPFSDGNGRLGRLWQSLILSEWQPVLAYLPMEAIIHQRQQEYYQLLAQADEQSDCTEFMVFLLQATLQALLENM